jgi:hypothetical protein
MVNPIRVKQYDFTAQSFSAAVLGNTVMYSERPINGEIKQVEFGTDQIFAIAMTPSGLPNQSIVALSGVSGTGVQIVYPYHFPQNSAGSIANSAMVPFAVNDVMKITLGSAVSGTTNFTCAIKYI